jgi:predicted transcriptional regulator
MLSPTAPAHVVKAQRQARALAMRAEGKRLHEIAEVLKVSTASVSRYISRSLAELAESSTERAEVLRERQNELVESAIKGILPKARAGDSRAVMALIACLNRQSRLWNLDMAPPQVSLSASSSSSIVSKMSDEELRLYAERAGLVIRGLNYPARTAQGVNHAAP